MEELKFTERSLQRIKKEMEQKKQEHTEAKTIMKEVERNIEGYDKELKDMGIEDIDGVEEYVDEKIKRANKMYEEILEESEKV